jgi:hypothetical protein
MPDSNARLVRDPQPRSSSMARRVRVSLKFLAVYGVAIVNGAALLYIFIRVWRYLSE